MKDLNRREMLCFLSRLGLSAVGLTAFSGLNQGCVTDLKSLTPDQAKSLFESGKKIVKAGSKVVEDITPEQAYYIGRTIGAVILQKYPPYWNNKANTYLNLMGQNLAQFSEMPVLYDGYHFLILDSKEINAFATPSGLIFVTRGLIHCCRDEEMLAAVLAHEIAHVQFKHGLNAIKASRVTDFLTITAVEGGKQFGSQDIQQLNTLFEDSIDDILSTMVNSGYSKSQEYDADQGAVAILKKTGYYSAGLPAMLREMKARLVAGRHDFFATHPTPEKRIAKLMKKNDGALDSAYQSKVRTQRFTSRTRGV